MRSREKKTTSVNLPSSDPTLPLRARVNGGILRASKRTFFLGFGTFPPKKGIREENFNMSGATTSAAMILLLSAAVACAAAASQDADTIASRMKRDNIRRWRSRRDENEKELKEKLYVADPFLRGTFFRQRLA